MTARQPDLIAKLIGENEPGSAYVPITPEIMHHLRPGATVRAIGEPDEVYRFVARDQYGVWITDGSRKEHVRAEWFAKWFEVLDN